MSDYAIHGTCPKTRRPLWRLDPDGSLTARMLDEDVLGSPARLDKALPVKRWRRPDGSRVAMSCGWRWIAYPEGGLEEQERIDLDPPAWCMPTSAIPVDVAAALAVGLFCGRRARSVETGWTGWVVGFDEILAETHECMLVLQAGPSLDALEEDDRRWFSHRDLVFLDREGA